MFISARRKTLGKHAQRVFYLGLAGKIMKVPINLKLSHKGLILVAIPLIFEILFVGILVVALKRTEYEIGRERHSKTVLYEANALLKDIMDSGMALYMCSTTGSEKMI